MSLGLFYNPESHRGFASPFCCAAWRRFLHGGGWPALSAPQNPLMTDDVTPPGPADAPEPPPTELPPRGAPEDQGLPHPNHIPPLVPTRAPLHHAPTPYGHNDMPNDVIMPVGVSLADGSVAGKPGPNAQLMGHGGDVVLNVQRSLRLV